MFAKVCGITTPEQLDWAIDLGYSAFGVVLHPGSIRRCSADHARDLARYAGGRIASVAVGLTFDEVAECSHEFDFVQIYEYRDLKHLIYAGDRPDDAGDRSLFLYDTSRGSGTSTGLPEWLHSIRHRLIISSGLGPENVADIIRRYRPFGVDVSSGVESRRGVKDYHLMKQFITEVTNAFR